MGNVADLAQCRRARPLLGTLVEIQARGAGAAEAVRTAFGQIEEIHRLMSRYEPASDIGRFNAAPVGWPIEMDVRTLAVLAVAAELQVASDGAFDCERSPAQSPSGCPGWTLEGAVLRKHRQVRLDLGGIAKGYAVDCAIEALRSFSLDYALVNAGGDMRHAGAAPARVALREPGSPARTAMMWQLDNAALASSSVGGLAPPPGAAPRIFSRREPLELPAAAGATVLAPSCMLADALTKVVLVCRAPRHPLLARYGACTLLYRDGKLRG
ncbi:FAD:protein FMN transferase [Cupriavidus basilensis]|uniref:FAD:protein FMN transferase n=1 Tax=Cupriavidus basilensis TaxID=68895 RepID=A0ABT6AGS9_9BURK|nr:FAD:protein FMN transferase [Cupriavidus basilensis]MDF3831803.1 FAD:protein FMN transferase [Cupriavidus basilensis]